jgi:putative acetyltransferase
MFPSLAFQMLKRAKLRGRSDLRAGPMSITIERVAEASPELHDLIGELNDILGAAYETHQRHGLSIDQLLEPHVRLFLARLDGVVVGCGGVAVFDDYAEVKRMYTRPAARGRGVAKTLLYIIQDEARRANKSVLRLETGTIRTLCGNASPQHRDESLLREDPSVDRRRCFSSREKARDVMFPYHPLQGTRDSNECRRASRPR